MPALASDFRRSLILSLLIGFALFMSPDSRAWWDTEHKKICENAYHLLNAASKAEVLMLLDRPFGEACIWADNTNQHALKPDHGTTAILFRGFNPLDKPARRTREMP